MSLVPVAWPQSESDLSVMPCTLEAHGIKAFVQGGGFGSMYPGPQIPFFNARRIMVPSENVAGGQGHLSLAKPAASVAHARGTGDVQLVRITQASPPLGNIPRRREVRAKSSSATIKGTRCISVNRSIVTGSRPALGGPLQGDRRAQSCPQ
jgi:hypothetical protein